MTRSTFRGLCVCLSAVALASCQDYDGGFTESQIKEAAYAKKFVKAFGEVDPNQDWNLATRASVTVSNANDAEVKIYAKTDGVYKIVADYTEVNGTQELGFDMLETVTELLVTNGSESYYVKPGESVSFSAATRTFIAPTSGNNPANISLTSDWVEFDATKFVDPVVKVGGVLPEGGHNLGNVVQNFSYISNGAFTIYPMFWCTSSQHILGVYWKENGEYHYQDIYKDKEGNELASRTITYSGQCYDTKASGERYAVEEVCPTHGKIQYIDSWGVPCTTQTITYNGYTSNTPQTGNIYSKGISVNLPVGTQFGFYLKVITDGTSYTHTAYSQAELNKQQKGDFFDTTNWPTAANVSGACSIIRNAGANYEGSYAWAATYQGTVDGQTVQYLCFEDWSYDGTDLNDLVFATPVTSTSTPPSIVDDDAHSWIICAEDLGNTFDLDYNDVVVEVSYVSGKNKATITPRAAGGTLASYIYFNGTSGDQCLGEIHELFGQDNTTSGGYTPLNVNGSIDASSSPIEVGVSTTWSIASSTVGDASFAGSSAMGGFYLKVVPAGEESSASNATINGQKIQNGTFGSGNDNAPLVFCVPRDWSRDEGTTRYSSWFRWSNELTPMSTLSGYTDPSYNTTGHSFANWVADHNAATDWYKYPVTGKTTGAKGITETTISNVPSQDPSQPVTPTGPTTPEGSISLMSYVGSGTKSVPASVFSEMTSATVTIVCSSTGFKFYGFTSSDENATWGDNVPGNVDYNGGTLEFELTSAHIEKINTAGSWKFTFNGQESKVSNFYITPGNN